MNFKIPMVRLLWVKGEIAPKVTFICLYFKIPKVRLLWIPKLLHLIFSLLCNCRSNLHCIMVVGGVYKLMAADGASFLASLYLVLRHYSEG
jgi:hypothetical protein